MRSAFPLRIFGCQGGIEGGFMRSSDQRAGHSGATGRLRARFLFIVAASRFFSVAASWAPVLFAIACAGTAAAQDLTLDQIGPVARAQIEALVAEKEARTPAQHKIDSALLRTIDAQRTRPRFPLLH